MQSMKLKVHEQDTSNNDLPNTSNGDDNESNKKTKSNKDKLMKSKQLKSYCIKILHYILIIIKSLPQCKLEAFLENLGAFYVDVLLNCYHYHYAALDILFLFSSINYNLYLANTIYMNCTFCRKK